MKCLNVSTKTAACAYATSCNAARRKKTKETKERSEKCQQMRDECRQRS